MANTIFQCHRTDISLLIVRELQRVGQAGVEAVIRNGEETNEVRFGFHVRQVVNSTLDRHVY